MIKKNLNFPHGNTVNQPITLSEVQHVFCEAGSDSFNIMYKSSHHKGLLPFSSDVCQYISIMYGHFYASNYNVHAVFSNHKFACCDVTH